MYAVEVERESMYNMPVKEKENDHCNSLFKHLEMRFHAHLASPLVVRMLACSLHPIQCPSFDSHIEGGELGIN